MNYLNIQGKGLKFNQGTWATFLQKIDHENYLATSNYAVVYAALWSNAYTKGEAIGMTFEQVCDFVDTLTLNEMKQIKEAFESMNQYKEALETQSDKQTTADEQKKTQESTVLTA